MNKNLIIFGIAVLLICVGLSGCDTQQGDSSELARFVGTWRCQHYGTVLTITCFSDGTCSWNGLSGFYELKDGKFVCDLPSHGITHTYEYSFSNNDKTLTLTDVSYGDTDVYTKQ